MRMEGEQVVEKRKNNNLVSFLGMLVRSIATHMQTTMGKIFSVVIATFAQASTGNILATIVNVGSGEKHYLILLCSHHTQRCHTCSREYDAEKAKQVKQEVQL